MALAAAGLLLTMAGAVDAADAVEPKVLESFADSDGRLGWRVVNDNVMGGRSLGGFEVRDGTLHFTGRTNTDGGGFSSLRTAPVALNLAGFDGIRLHVQGDGRRYTWRLATDLIWRGLPVAYWADFETSAGKWETVDIPFTDFVPRARGARLDGSDVDPSNIMGMGLMIYDKKDGDFAIRLRDVQAYTAAFSLASLRWNKRVLVVAAPDIDNAELVRQMAALDATRAAFDERDMLLVVATEERGAMAAGRAMSDAESADVRRTLAMADGGFSVLLLGKDGGVKLRESGFVDMARIYALIDGMPMRRLEMRERQ